MDLKHMDADRHFPLLEYGSREHGGGSQAGRRGTADHAVSGTEHGLALETEGGRRSSRYTYACSGRNKNFNQLYQINGP